MPDHYYEEKLRKKYPTKEGRKKRLEEIERERQRIRDSKEQRKQKRKKRYEEKKKDLEIREREINNMREDMDDLDSATPRIRYRKKMMAEKKKKKDRTYNLS